MGETQRIKRLSETPPNVPVWRGRCAEGEFSIDIDGKRSIVTLSQNGEVIAYRQIELPGAWR